MLQHNNKQFDINAIVAYDGYETLILEAEQDEENVENDMFVQQMCKGEE